MSSLRSRPSDTSSLVTYGSETLSIHSNSTESPRYNALEVKKQSSISKIKNALTLKRTRSSSRLAGGSSSRLDLTEAYRHPVPPLRFSDPEPSPPLGRMFTGKKKKPSEGFLQPTARDGVEYPLDRNIENMDGIIDPNIVSELSTTPTQYPDPHSPVSGFATSTESSGISSDVSSIYQQYSSTISPSPPPGGPSFTHPWHSLPGGPAKRKLGLNGSDFERRISPKTPAPLTTTAVIPHVGAEASWTPPESWEVEKGEDFVPGSGSDGDEHTYNSGSSFRNMSGRASRKKTKRSAVMSMSMGRHGDGRYKIRIYRAGNAYHLANLRLTDTVQQIIPYLNDRLLLDPERETHRLYLKERGRGVLQLLLPRCRRIKSINDIG